MPPGHHDFSALEHPASTPGAHSVAYVAAPLSEPGFWNRLFSPEGYMPRRICGDWTNGEIWLHNASDFFIWTAYLAIPLVLVFFWARKRNDLPFHRLFLLFGLFIVACGTTHLMEIVMFYHPIYRFAGLVKLVTAAVSWGTVMALIPSVPHALRLRSPEALEKEVQERTAQLATANRIKDELLEREHRARQEAELARQEAESASRAKDEFLMTLSHELRTPLNSIQGWASLLRTGHFDDDMREQALETIERNAWLQAQLVDDILEVSRVTAGKLIIAREPVMLQKVVEAAVLSARPAAESKGVALQLRLEDPDSQVTGDAARLQQVVWNLLANAIKFTPKGGEICVRLTREESQALLQVSDTGEGIATEFLPFVFERFRQADSSASRRYGGLGLGLAIVRHLVELHGGVVRAESDGMNRGATFTVSLPLRAVAGENSQKTMVTASSASSVSVLPGVKRPLEGLRLLTVDDEAEARALIATILRLQGADVHVASTADEAFELWQSESPDLIVSDVGMPGQNGYQFMQRLRVAETRKGLSPIPTLALTAYAAAGDRQNAIEAGFNSHLAKPVLPATLVAEVAKLVGR